MGWRTTTRSAELILLAVLAGCFAFSCGAPQTKEPKATTICSVASNPTLYDGDLIKVQAIVRSNGSHSTVLYDPSCPEAGGLALLERGGDRQPDVRALRDVLPVGEPVLPGTEIRGTFIGKFRWRSTERPSRTIELVKASDVMKRPLTQSSDH
jgi:hypothetical protein